MACTLQSEKNIERTSARIIYNESIKNVCVGPRLVRKNMKPNQTGRSNGIARPKIKKIISGAGNFNIYLFYLKRMS